MIYKMLRSVVSRIRDLSPRFVLCIGLGIIVVYAFPGQLTRDSYDHLSEARNGFYTDSHPPAINLLWMLVDTVIAGPICVLLLQNAMFLGGCYFVLRRTFAPRRAAWIAVAVLLFPPVMTTMAVIWKDCVMAGFLAIGLAGLLSERRGYRMLGLAAMIGATTMRYNALGATLPLVVLLFQWRAGMHWLARYGIATAAWFVITVAGFGINIALTDREMHYWESSLAVHDIVGTLALVDGDLSDDELRARLAGTQLLTQRDIHARMRALYRPQAYYPIVNGDRRMWDLPIDGYVPAPAAQRDAIAHAWWTTITTHFGTYAKHRVRVTKELLGLGKRRAFGAIVLREQWAPNAQALGLVAGPSKLQRKLTAFMDFVVADTPLFLPYLYAIVTILLLPLALRHRDVLAILLSGLAMESTLMLLAHGDDFRYSHWLVITTAIGAIVLAVRRYRRAPAAPPRSEQQHGADERARDHPV